MKKAIKTIIAVMIILISIVTVPEKNIGANTEDMWLSISKNTEGPRYIVDSNGKPFRLFGMARSQMCEPWDETPRFGDIRSLCSHYKELGCNSIRLAISFSNQEYPYLDFVSECGGYNPKGLRKFIEKYVEPDVRGIIDSGMYVVLDLHEYPKASNKNDPNPQELLDDAGERYIPLWIELAKYYKDEPMIAMYELWNEPYAADQKTIFYTGSGKIRGGSYDGYDWNKGVQEFFIECSNEIRKYDTRHILLISDWNAGWGAAWESAWAKNKYAMDPEYKNVIFSIHAGYEQFFTLDSDGWNYDVYWADISKKHNIAFQFGEIEAETKTDTDLLPKFIQMLNDRADIYHYPVMLWRARSDVINRADLWTSFAKSYASPVKIEEETSGSQSSTEDKNKNSVREQSSGDADNKSRRESVVDNDGFISDNGSDASTEQNSGSDQYQSTIRSDNISGKISSAEDFDDTDIKRKDGIVILVAIILMLGVASAVLFLLDRRNRKSV